MEIFGRDMILMIKMKKNNLGKLIKILLIKILLIKILLIKIS